MHVSCLGRCKSGEEGCVHIWGPYPPAEYVCEDAGIVVDVDEERLTLEGGREGGWERRGREGGRGEGGRVGEERRGREEREEREGGEGGRRGRRGREEREEREGGRRGREEREGGEGGRRGREEREGGEEGMVRPGSLGRLLTFRMGQSKASLTTSARDPT